MKTPPAPVETELKLACDLSALDALKAHPLLAEGASRPKSRLVSTYYDAVDEPLRKAGMSLRVRIQGRNATQTLKTKNGGGLSRGEWETEIDGPEIDRRTLRGTPAAKLLKSEKLVERFTVMVERQAYLVRYGASEIEVALDEGRIAAPHAPGSVSISEVELELKDGQAADLFELARALGANAPLRVSLKSKSEHGYDLAAGAVGKVVKAGAVPLADDMTASEALQAIAYSCLRHLRANETILLTRRDAKALHQTRVAVRRLRSALSVFRPIIHDGGADRFGSRLKALIEPLGRARDLDVMLGRTLPKERERRPDETGLLNLETRLETERDAAYLAVDAFLRSQEWRDFFLELTEWVEVGPWLSTSRKRDFIKLTQPASSFAREALERRRRQVKKLGAKVDEIDDASRHRVRIAAKKLRYGAEFFASLYDGKKASKRHAAFVSSLKALQKELGDLNDLATAGACVAALGEDGLTGRSSIFAAGVASADLDHDGAGGLNRARTAYDAFLMAKPFWR